MENKFKERLKAARKAKGMTQSELADICETSQILISYYEGGQRKPGLDMLVKMINALGVSADCLLGIKH